VAASRRRPPDRLRPHLQRGLIAGTQVTLTASVGAGAVFTGWSGGGCSGTDACQVTLNANTNVTAIFDAGSTLTVVRTGAGLVSSSGPGIACGGLCAFSYANGTQVTLTAQAAPGFEFGGFSGAGCSSTDPCTVTLGGDTTVNATFNLVTPMVIQLFTNGAAFSTGQLLSLTAVAANPGPRGVGDFYLGAVLPPAAGPGLCCPAGDALVFFADGGTTFAIRCLSSPASTFPPFLANVSVPGGLPPVVVPLFSLIWPAGAPPGPYTFFGALTALSAFNGATLNFADVVANGLAGVFFTP
jgi:Divergent InlB B-repeat domain